MGVVLGSRDIGGVVGIDFAAPGHGALFRVNVQNGNAPAVSDISIRTNVCCIFFHETKDNTKDNAKGEDTQSKDNKSTGSSSDQADTDRNPTSGQDGSSADNSSGDTSGSGDSSDEDTAMTCTFSIECSTILNNWNDLKESKAEFVPADGWILYPSEVEFYEGETVFDVLKRVCNEAGIQMESEWTPMYNSYYVSGINNLYEFDCGKDSGWMYCVNGWYPNYGCSKYTLEDGDTVEWRYTCNLGRDVGDQYYD